MYELTIIGAGWAGFNAALEAKARGLKVALVEKAEIGGTCLNRGCISTKTLIQSAKTLEQVKKCKTFGISFGSLVEVLADFPQIQARKEKVILQLRQGMQSRLLGIDYFNSEAELLDKSTIKLKDDRELQSKFLLIASGSRPIELDSLRFNGKNILSSDEALNLKTLPRSILIVGGGVIGCEFASLFSDLGVKVNIVELTAQLLPGEDKEIARKLETSFKKRGIAVNTNTDASKVDFKEYELILVCVGRKPERGGIEKLGLEVEKGKIKVDEFLKTNIDGVYAAGDCTGRLMLAHFAAYQGRIAASNITQPDNLKKADNSIIPNCIFTNPEIASVGLSEELAKNKGIELKIGRFDFLGSAMAGILDETEGFIKIISEVKTGRILGASIIGYKATELIGVLAVAVNLNLSISQLRDVILPHPTLAEGITEALD